MHFQIILACFAVLYGSCRARIHHHPKPYRFGYIIKDKESVQTREEAGDGVGNVKGNYGFTDNKGIRRQVDYVADHGGFRARVKTNEPGTSNQNPASVNWVSNDPYAQGGGIPYNSQPNVPYVPALYMSEGRYGLPTLHDFHAFIPEDATISVGGLSRSNILGAGLIQEPATVYYGGNLIGGRITGTDSRFSTL